MYMHIAMVCIMREGEGKRERDKQRKTEAEKEITRTVSKIYKN